MAMLFFFRADPLAVPGACRRVLAGGGRLAVCTIPSEGKGTAAAPEPPASRSNSYDDGEVAAPAPAAGWERATVSRTDGGQRLVAYRG
jgi:hypothetical protein